MDDTAGADKYPAFISGQTSSLGWYLDSITVDATTKAITLNMAGPAKNFSHDEILTLVPAQYPVPVLKQNIAA